MTHTEDMYKLVWSKVRIDGRMLQRIVRIGIPAGMQSVMYNISNIIIQSGVNTLGTDNVTAWATYGKVDGLYWMMINALGISVTTFVGQNYGAGRMDRVHKGAGACMIIGTIMTAIVSTLLYLKGYLLIDLFTSDAQVQEIGLSLIHFLVPTLITYITIEILSGTLRGVGDAWMPLIMTGIGVCCLRVIWIIFSCHSTDPSWQLRSAILYHGPLLPLPLLFIISSSAVCGAWTEESGFRKRIIKRAIKGVVS